MARRGAIPASLGDINRRTFVPGRATVWAGILSVIWYVLISILSSNVLGDCVAGLGFLVCIYYGFTGFTCTIYYRRELRKSAKNFLTLGLIPTLGGAVLMAILGYGDRARGAGGCATPLSPRSVTSTVWSSPPVPPRSPEARRRSSCSPTGGGPAARIGG